MADGGSVILLWDKVIRWGLFVPTYKKEITENMKEDYGIKNFCIEADLEF